VVEEARLRVCACPGRGSLLMPCGWVWVVLVPCVPFKRVGPRGIGAGVVLPLRSPNTHGHVVCWSYGGLP
jgi:hypothetical protein